MGDGHLHPRRRRLPTHALLSRQMVHSISHAYHTNCTGRPRSVSDNLREYVNYSNTRSQGRPKILKRGAAKVRFSLTSFRLYVVGESQAASLSYLSLKDGAVARRFGKRLVCREQAAAQTRFFQSLLDKASLAQINRAFLADEEEEEEKDGGVSVIQLPGEPDSTPKSKHRKTTIFYKGYCTSAQLATSLNQIAPFHSFKGALDR